MAGAMISSVWAVGDGYRWLTAEVRALRRDGLDAWTSSRSVPEVALLFGLLASAWMGIRFLGSMFRPGSVAYSYAGILWLLTGLAAIWLYLGRRRSLRKYEEHAETVSIAELLDMRVPENPPAMHELVEALRSEPHAMHPGVRGLLIVALLSLIELAVAPIWNPLVVGDLSVGVIALLLFTCVLPLLGECVAHRRRQRYRAFREAVHNTVSRLAGGDVDGLRRKLSDEIDASQARLDELRRLAGQLATQVPLDVHVLTEVQRIGLTLDVIQKRAQEDDFRARTRDWWLMAIGAVVGGVVGFVVSRAGEAIWPTG